MTNDITTKKHSNGKAKAIIASILCVALMIGIIAGATLTTTGRAIVFAIQDPGTVNHAAQLKSDYVKQFALTGPKDE